MYELINTPATVKIFTCKLLAVFLYFWIKGFTMNIAFWGDSLTEGIPGSSFYRILTTKHPENSYRNFGLAGDTSESMLSRMIHGGLTQQYDLVFLWIGTNDVFMFSGFETKLLRHNFRRNFQEIITELKKFAKTIICIPPLIIGENQDDPSNREAEIIAEEIRDECHESELNYLDLRTAFLEEISKNPGNKLTTDGVHLNDIGAELIADWIYTEIKKQEQK